MSRNISKKEKTKALCGVFLAFQVIFGILMSGTSGFVFADANVPGHIDFSDSAWLDTLMEEAGVYGMDFVQESAFSCGQNKGKVLYLYASQKSVEELRGLYQEGLHAEPHDRNDETAMHLEAKLSRGTLEISNIFSQVCRLIRLDLALQEDETARIEEQLLEAFPWEELEKVSELHDILSRERYGIYVRYLYDNINSYLSMEQPIFSCAFEGTEQEYEELAEALQKRFSHNAFDVTDNTWYFEDGEGTLGLTPVKTEDGKQLLSLLYQPE